MLNLRYLCVYVYKHVSLRHYRRVNFLTLAVVLVFITYYTLGFRNRYDVIFLQSIQVNQQEHFLKTPWKFASALYNQSHRHRASLRLAQDIKKENVQFVSPFVIRHGASSSEITHSNCAAADPLNESASKVDCVGHRNQFIIREDNGRRVRARTVSVIRSCENGSVDCLQLRKFSFVGCRYSQCLPTKTWQTADVLVIEPFYLQKKTKLPKFRRPPTQRWVMFSMEAPCRMPQYYNLNTSQFQGQFNWSMTYNLDSDVPNLYGHLRLISPEPLLDYDSVYSSKTVHAAWFVSHCDTLSLRQQYVTRMQKIIEVHVYGHCGNRNCSLGTNHRHKDKTECLPLLSGKYFFYLAFENSICKDYVTEKLFKLFPVAMVLPVVRGGLDYKHYLPPDTYVDASDYDSPEALAVGLKKLSGDKARYLRMLREKSMYESVDDERWQCKLCEKMTKDHSVQWYPRNTMWTWFVRDKCQNPLEI